jgi:hypothetical protein
MDQLLLVLVIQGIVFGGFSAFIASQKKRSSTSWFFLGFIFSLLAILALIAVPNLEKTGLEEKLEGYIRLSKYAKANGLTISEVMTEIDKGTIQGKCIGGTWYVAETSAEGD